MLRNANAGKGVDTQFRPGLPRRIPLEASTGSEGTWVPWTWNELRISSGKSMEKRWFILKRHRGLELLFGVNVANHSLQIRCVFVQLL